MKAKIVELYSGVFLFVKNHWQYLLLIVTAIVLSSLFIAYFFSKEQYIYFWEWVFYWSRFQQITDLMRHHPLDAIKALIYSTRHTEYSLLAPFILAPAGLFFGTSRLLYIFSVTNIFAVPAVFLLATLTAKIYGLNLKKAVEPIAVVLLAAFFIPQFWLPILYGYYDVSGLVVTSIIFLILFSKKLEEQDWRRLMLIGFFLVVLVFLRRWYVYWVVSFFAANLFVFFFDNENYHLKIFWRYFRNLGLIGITALVLIFAAAEPVIKQILTPNYADMYSAYRQAYGDTTSVVSIFKQLFFSYGLIFSLTAAAGFGCMIYNKKTRAIGLFLFIQTFISIVLFTRIQFFDRHHHYLFLGNLIVFIGGLVFAQFEKIKGRLFRMLFLGSIVILFAVNFAASFNPKFSAAFQSSFSFLFASTDLRPLERNDLEQIHSMVSYMQGLPLDPGDKIYVLASSLILNGDIVKFSCERKENSLFNVCDRVITSFDIDKRDGFPNQLFTARYVVIGYPIQYHIPPDGQRVIGIPAELISQKQGFGRAYDLLPGDFTLGNNVKVKIYEKVRPIQTSDLQSLQDMFSSLYPEYKDKFFLVK